MQLLCLSRKVSFFKLLLFNLTFSSFLQVYQFNNKNEGIYELRVDLRVKHNHLSLFAS